MASHQTFSGQLWHLTDQTKFDQTNLLCIINGEVNKFKIGKQMSGQFSTLIISTVLCYYSVHRGMLWILGEYCTSVEEIMRVIVEIRTALGEVSATHCTLIY